MKRKLSAVLVLVLASAVIAVAPASAKSPLRGDIDLDFNVGVVLGEGCAPQVAWFGTVGIEGQTFGIVFDDGPMIATGPVFHWTEGFRIYESLTYTMQEGVVATCSFGALLLEGTVEGIMAPYGGGPANGVVTAADGDFADWDGRRIHMFGAVTEVYTDGLYAEWGLPKASAMTIRIN